MTKRSLPFKQTLVKRPTQQRNKTVENITNIKLSDEQASLKSKILSFIDTNLVKYDNNNNFNKPFVFLINGDAGTGKSIILNSLFNNIQKISRTTNDSTLSGSKNYLVVNHPEMLKLYQQISTSFPYINKSDLERPTSLINKYSKLADMEKIDVLIIDEAHLLATFKDPFKKFYQNNHLLELLKISKIVILVFDDKQSLRMGSFWSLENNGDDDDDDDKNNDGASLLQTLSNNVSQLETFQLTKQFRVVAQPDLTNWINQISTLKTFKPLPIEDSKILQGGGGFDFKIFDDCSKMYDLIKIQNDKHGQSRILSTYDFPYRLDQKDYFVTSQSDSFKLRWDRYLPSIKIPWSERHDTIEEVGSVYTIQGFDLNYAGVILGRSIGYDRDNDCLKIHPQFYDDHAGFTKKSNIHNVDKVKEKIILNSLNVLLTRGRMGLYIFAWDNELRGKLLENADPKIIG